MTDRDLAARDRAEAGDATPRDRAAAPSEDGERVAQPSDYDLGSTPDRTRDGLARPVAGEPTAPVTEDRTAPVAEDRTAPVAEDRTAPVAEDRTAPVVDEPGAPVVDEPAVPVAEEPAEVLVRPRTSGAAVIGALLAAFGLCGALTGLLAPEGFVVSIIGGLLCLGAMASTARRPIAGRGLAAVGLIGALAGVVIAVLAMTKQFTWPNSGVDEISRWHAWLVAHWSWLGRWT